MSVEKKAKKEVYLYLKGVMMVNTFEFHGTRLLEFDFMKRICLIKSIQYKEKFKKNKG